MLVEGVVKRKRSAYKNTECSLRVADPSDVIRMVAHHCVFQDQMVYSTLFDTGHFGASTAYIASLRANRVSTFQNILLV